MNDNIQNGGINTLTAKLVSIIFNNSVRTAKKTPHFTITKINRLTLFKEINVVCNENHMKRTNTKRSFTDVKTADAYSYKTNLKR
jgi:hypothetical protein